jgi:hypothetical protein
VADADDATCDAESGCDDCAKAIRANKNVASGSEFDKVMLNALWMQARLMRRYGVGALRPVLL